MRSEKRGAHLRGAVVAAVTVLCTSWLGSLAAGETTMSNAVNRLLRGPGVANHPVGVVPTAATTIPEGWPLDSDGSITCLTCHTALPSAEGWTSPHLRDFEPIGSESTEFCAKCHGDSTSQTASGMHWMAVGTAHVQPQHGKSSQANRLLDSESRRCMGCHDGVSARESDNPTPGSSGFGMIGDRHRSHPVGVAYGGRSMRGSASRLRPISSLPKQVHLPGGQVSCLSCHDLYAVEQDRLTVSTNDSALCFTCHDLG